MLHLDLFTYDQELRQIRGDFICGVDEAGRGPLAGPVACAAVVMPPFTVIEGLTDSKRMTDRQRQRVFEIINKMAVSCTVVLIDNEEIDRLNILNATLKGMRQAVESLNIKPDYTIVDGNKVPAGIADAEAVVKGDGISGCIAAASVVAKVVRDRFMLKMDKQYPEYHFAQHKGYPTKLHYEMIEKHGITPIHRKTFLKGRV